MGRGDRQILDVDCRVIVSGLAFVAVLTIVLALRSCSLELLINLVEWHDKTGNINRVFQFHPRNVLELAVNALHILQSAFIDDPPLVCELLDLGLEGITAHRVAFYGVNTILALDTIHCQHAVWYIYS